MLVLQHGEREHEDKQRTKKQGNGSDVFSALMRDPDWWERGQFGRSVVVSITVEGDFRSRLSIITRYLYRKKNVTEGILSLKERTPGCNAKGRKLSSEQSWGGRHYYLLPPQQSTPASFCIKLGFSGDCCLGWGVGLLAGAARFWDRFCWLC